VFSTICASCPCAHPPIPRPSGFPGAKAASLWVSYAGGGQEAYQRPFVFLDLTQLDGDHDGRPDLQEGAQPVGDKGLPAFLDPAH